MRRTSSRPAVQTTTRPSSATGRPSTAGARPSSSHGRIGGSQAQNSSSGSRIKWNESQSGGSTKWPTFSWTRTGSDRRPPVKPGRMQKHGSAPTIVVRGSAQVQTFSAQHRRHGSGGQLNEPSSLRTFEPIGGANSEAGSAAGEDPHTSIRDLKKDIRRLQKYFADGNPQLHSAVDKALQRYIATKHAEHNKYSVEKLGEILVRCTSEMLATSLKRQQRRRSEQRGMVSPSTSPVPGDSGLGSSVVVKPGQTLNVLIDFAHHTNSLLVEHGQLWDKLAAEKQRVSELLCTVKQLEEEKTLGKLALISNKLQNPAFSSARPSSGDSRGESPPTQSLESRSSPVPTATMSVNTAASPEGTHTATSNAATSPGVPGTITRDQATAFSPKRLQSLNSNPVAKAHATDATEQQSVLKPEITDSEEDISFLRRQRDAKQQELVVVKEAERKLFDKNTALRKKINKQDATIKELKTKVKDYKEKLRTLEASKGSAVNSELEQAQAQLKKFRKAQSLASETSRKLQFALQDGFQTMSASFRGLLSEPVLATLSQFDQRLQNADASMKALSSRYHELTTSLKATRLEESSLSKVDEAALNSRHETEIAMLRQNHQAEVETLKSELLDLKTSHQRATDQIATMTRELEQAKKQLQQAIADHTEVSELQLELKRSQHLVTVQAEDLEDAKTKIDRLERTLSKLRLKSSELSKQLSDNQGLKNKGARRIENLEQQLSDAKQKFLTADLLAKNGQKTIANLNLQLESERQTIEQLRREAVGAAATTDSTAELERELQEAIASGRAATEEAEAKHKAAIAAEQLSLQQLWSGKLSKACTKWNAELVEERRQRARAEEQAAAVLAQASNGTRDLERKHRAAQQSINVLQQQLESEQQACNSALRDNSDLETTAKSLRQELAEVQARLSSSLQQLQEESQSASELKTVKGERDATGKQLAELKKKLLIVQGQMGLELDHWKEVAHTEQSKFHEAEKNLKSSRSHYESVIETLKGQVEQSKSRDSEISTETAALTSDLKTANTLLAMQRNKREEMQREIEKLRQDNAAAREETSKLLEKWDTQLQDMKRERAEIDTEKEILRSVEETIFLRLKQQLELAELEPTLQASPEQAGTTEWQSAYDRVQVLQDSVAQKEAKLRTMATKMQTRRRTAALVSHADPATDSSPKEHQNRKTRRRQARGTPGKGYHHDGGVPGGNSKREEMMKRVSSVTKMRKTVAAHRAE